MTENKISPSEWIGILGAIGAFINIIIISWQAWKRSKPEIKKINAEGESEIAEAAESIAQGSKTTVESLLLRITSLEADLASEKEARRRDTEYLRRRIKDAEQESRDYRNWAAQLAKQVIEAGKNPVPFIPSMDTDEGLSSPAKKENQ